MEIDIAALNDESVVNKLPVEILLKIFEYLGKDDLKAAVLVCPNWNDIISQNASTMKSLPLILGTVTRNNLTEIMSLTRKFSKIILNETIINSDTLAIIEKHKTHVRNLVMRKMYFYMEDDTEPAFLQLLRHLRQLEKLTCEAIKSNFNFVVVADINIADLPHLKNVVLNDCSPTILHFIDTSRVASLKQNNYFSYQLFVKNLPKLEELVIKRETFEFQRDMGFLQIPLKKLSATLDDDNALLALMKICKDTLEELEIGNKCSPSVYEFVFKKLRKLKLLKINIENLPSEQELVEVLKPNITVTTLILHAKTGFALAQHFIGNLPSVETLILNFNMERGDSNLLMTFTSINLPKLRVLEVRQLGNNTFLNVNIPTLEELHIHESNSLSNEEWRITAQSCPNITRITVERVFNSFLFSNSVIQLFSENLRKLEHLVIGYGFIANIDIFNLLSSSLSLKSLILLKDAIEDDPSMITDFCQTDKRLMLLDNVPSNIRKDFQTWIGEDVNLSLFSAADDRSFDSHYDGSDFSGGFDYENDDEMDHDEDLDFHEYYEDNISDDEFNGAFRPG